MLVVLLWSVNCRFWFGVWNGKSLYLLIQVSLLNSTVHKEIYKKYLTLTTQKSPLGGKLSLSHTHIGLPWVFNLNLPKSNPVTFIRDSHPPCINSLNPNIYLRKIILQTDSWNSLLREFAKKIKAFSL